VLAILRGRECARLKTTPGDVQGLIPTDTIARMIRVNGTEGQLDQPRQLEFGDRLDADRYHTVVRR
jgi:hypothetical protein